MSGQTRPKPVRIELPDAMMALEEPEKMQQ
jgi:hypothetical protein